MLRLKMTMNKRLICCVFAAATMVVVGCNRSESPEQSSAKKLRPAQPATTPPALPPGHPNIDTRSQPLPHGAPAEVENPKWTVPKDWQEGKRAPMRRASFVVNGPDDQVADIAVTAFPGDVGGMAMNISRWRSQLGLDPITADQVGSMTSKLDVNGVAATLVDLSSEQPPEGKTHLQRMIVVTVPQAGNSWFFKMIGDDSLVAAQKDAFLQFVKSA